MSELATGISAASSLAGAGTKAYGAWYSGKQASEGYETEAALTMRSKAEKTRAIEMQKREAGLVRDQADETLQDAEYIKRIGEIKAQRYQKESDTAISSGFAKMAKSGVAMNFGSPLDVIDNAVNERAKNLEILNFETNVDYWHKKNQARNIKEKATIMLDTAKVNESNLGMYDYQAQMYEMAGKEAKNAADWKMMSAYFGAMTDVFGTVTKYKKENPSTDKKQYNDSDWWG